MGKASRRKRQQRSSSHGDRTHAAAAEVPAPNFDRTAEPRSCAAKPEPPAVLRRPAPLNRSPGPARMPEPTSVPDRDRSSVTPLHDRWRVTHHPPHRRDPEPPDPGGECPAREDQIHLPNGWRTASMTPTRLTGLPRDLLDDQMRRGTLSSCIKSGGRRLITRQRLRRSLGAASWHEDLAPARHRAGFWPVRGAAWSGWSAPRPAARQPAAGRPLPRGHRLPRLNRRPARRDLRHPGRRGRVHPHPRRRPPGRHRARPSRRRPRPRQHPARCPAAGPGHRQPRPPGPRRRIRPP